MKTKSLLVITLFTLASLFFMITIVSNINHNELFSANLEALAETENLVPATCYNSITTSAGEKVLYCATCQYIDGKKTWYSGSGLCHTIFN